MRGDLVIGLAGTLLLTACASGSDAEGASLQSSCVHGVLNLPRTLPTGAACDNFGYGDCGAGNMGSTCTGVCAHAVCQPGPCTSDTACAAVKSGLECFAYVVSGLDYGAYCGVSTCPKGTPGCPCVNGVCAQTGISGQSVACTANRCVLTDTCRSGCRVGSVCCGGAFCGGNCVGTPCC